MSNKKKTKKSQPVANSDIMISNNAPCGYRCRACGTVRPMSETQCSCNGAGHLKYSLGEKMLLLEKNKNR